MATSAQLAAALRQMPSRPAQTLRLRLLEGHSREQCATLYGVSPELFDALLYRAAVDLTATLDGVALPSPGPLEALWAGAQALQLALQTGQAGPPATALLELTRSRDEVRALLEQAELADQRSPARHRETWLRRVGIVVVIALTVFFYWQQTQREQHRPKFEPRPAPPAQSR